MRLYTTLSKIFEKAGSIDICLKCLIKHGPSALNTGTAYLSSLSLSGKIPVIKDEVRAYCNGLQILRNNFDPVLDVIDNTFFSISLTNVLCTLAMSVLLYLFSNQRVLY